MTNFNQETAKNITKPSWEERSKAWSGSWASGPVQDNKLNQAIISEAGIKSGHHVLDIASGAGNPAISAALLMGESGSITLTDLSEGMLKNAHIRASNHDISIMNFCCADMANLPFSDKTFDVAICRFGIMFVQNKMEAAKEALRVLKSGGNFTYMVWDAYNKNPPFFVPTKVISEFFEEKEPEIPTRHSMCSPGLLKSILERAGYINISEKQIGYKNRVLDLKQYVSNGLKRSRNDRIKNLNKDELIKLKNLILKAWAPYESNGVTEIPNCARVCTGLKP